MRESTIDAWMGGRAGGLAGGQIRARALDTHPPTPSFLPAHLPPSPPSATSACPRDRSPTPS